MERLRDTLKEFLADYYEYLPETIPELDKLPTSNEFLNNYVLTNLPFVAKCDEFDQFPAIKLWQDHGYVRKLMENKIVTVAVTPDGRSESIVDDQLMIPEDREMFFNDFFESLFLSDTREIYCLQKQNNLIEEFSPLVKDVVSHVPWVTEAFGNHPDAVNVLIGNQRSFTSLRKDHYENIFYVITGQKTFYLYPPVAISWMPYKKFKKFQWHFEGAPGSKEDWHMKDLNEEVEWIVPSHKPETLEKFKRFCDAKSFVVNVRPGEVLYIPAMWFHEACHTNPCIAVNYWYGMKHDMKYPFLDLLNKLCHLPILHKDASVDKQSELEDSLLSDLHGKKEKNE